MKRASVLILFMLFMSLTGCNALSRKFGGSTDSKLPCGRKLVNVTWKESSLWVVSRPMRAGEEPESYTFQEDSNLGVLEGSVTISECK